MNSIASFSVKSVPGEQIRCLERALALERAIKLKTAKGAALTAQKAFGGKARVAAKGEQARVRAFRVQSFSN